MKLRVFALHPVQYQAPMWRALARHPGVTDFKVWFGWEGHSGRREFDPGFGREFEWEADLLDGYASEFLRNFAVDPRAGGFVGRINPALVARVLRERPEGLLVVGHGTLSGVLALLSGRLARIPTMLYGDYSEPARPYLDLPRRAVVRMARLGAATGARNRKLYESAGFQENRIVRVPFSVDNSHFRRPSQSAMRSGEAAVRTVVVKVAKMIPIKEHALVLRALGRLPDHERPTLRLVGSGPLESELRALAQTLGVSPWVEFRGFKNYQEIPGEYWEASCSVLASSREPWGLAVNESMAAGVAAIVSEACGCVDDLIIDGVTGLRFRSGDEEGLASALRTVVLDRDRWSKMGESAAAHIDRFDVTAAADAIVGGFRRCE